MCFFHLQYGTPVQHRGAHEHHAVAWDSGRGGIVDVVGFKNHFAVGGHRDAISVGQRQGFVVVQNWVEVLNPDGVNRSVEDYPDVLSWKGDKKILAWVKDIKVLLCYIGHDTQLVLNKKFLKIQKHIILFLRQKIVRTSCIISVNNSNFQFKAENASTSFSC